MQALSAPPRGKGPRPRAALKKCDRPKIKRRGRPKAASLIPQATVPSLVARARSRPIAPRQGGGAYHRLILVEARQAIGTQLRIADRPALPAHARLAEAGANLQQPVIVAALDHVPARIPVAEIAAAGLRPVGDELIADNLRVRGRRQRNAGGRKSETNDSFHHDPVTPSRGWSPGKTSGARSRFPRENSETVNSFYRPKVFTGPKVFRGQSFYRPTGSGNPRLRHAANSVFRKRHAIVMGPTPPGTGVIAPATW